MVQKPPFLSCYPGWSSSSLSAPWKTTSSSSRRRFSFSLCRWSSGRLWVTYVQITIIMSLQRLRSRWTATQLKTVFPICAVAMLLVWILNCASAKLYAQFKTGNEFTYSMCAMDILAAQQLTLQAVMNAPDLGRYFRAPADAADRHKKSGVARGCSAPQACCFYLCVVSVKGHVQRGNKEPQGSLCHLHVWQRRAHAGMSDATFGWAAAIEQRRA